MSQVIWQLKSYYPHLSTISQVRQDSDPIPPGLSLARRLSASLLRAAMAPEAAEAAANAALAAASGVAKALLLWRWQRLQMALEMETWKARRLETWQHQWGESWFFNDG